MIRIRRPALLLSVPLALTIAACGSSSSSSGPASPGGGSASSTNGHTVVIKNFAFGPSTIHVKVGTTVTWTNDDAVPHTVTDVTGPQHFDSQAMPDHKTFSMTFTKKGTYSYRCNFHQQMHGTVVVS